MLRRLLPEEPILFDSKLAESIFESLKDIQQRMEEEIANKQKTIEDNYEEIRLLRHVIQQKDQSIHELKEKVDSCQRNTEGNRQIINKLLNDLDRMRQDIAWYKRTYESRSLLGYIKQYLKGRAY